MIQWMLAIWSLVPLPSLKPAWTFGSSRFTYCWSLAWRILHITLLACEMSAIVWDLIRLKSFWITKETINEMKTIACRMGENICKGYDWQEVSIQNIQTTHTTQYHKTNSQPKNKQKTFLQRRHTGFPGCPAVKNPPCNMGAACLISGPRRSHMPRSN